MPIPEPNQGEPREEFINRCMADEAMISEFPDESQRYAVCSAQLENIEGSRVNLKAEFSVNQAVQNEPRRFRIVAYTGNPMRITGYSFPVIVDITGLRPASDRLPVLVEHQYDIEYLLGQTDKVYVENGNIIAEGVISAVGEKSRAAIEAYDKGFKWFASIGASVVKQEFLPAGKLAVVNGKEIEGPLIIARESELVEISAVILGADVNTSLAAKRGASNMEAQNMTDNAENNVNNVEQSIAEIRAAAKAETERIAAIMRICASNPSIASKAIDEGWTVERAELELLRATRPQVNIVSGDNSFSKDIIAAAVCMTGKLDDNLMDYPEQVLEAAHKRYPRGIGLQEIFIEAARAAGHTFRSFRSNMADILQAAFSTADISGILSNIANKFLLEGFYSVEDTWKRISAIRSVGDFKTVTSYRMIDGGSFEEVAPTGELRHGTLSEETYTNQAKTYGKIFGISRVDMINDDLGALTNLPRMIGASGARKINDVFWRTFMNNSTFFTTARKNYKAGADTALGVDGLTTAELMFLTQELPGGEPLGVQPKFLLVPPALQVVASQLMKSAELRDTTASTKYLTANPHAGKFEILASAYLSNTNYTGNSSKAWYLLAAPNMLPVIETAFLNGQQVPIIEQAAADFDVLGVRFRGYLDFGVSLQDYRGGVKMKGEA